MDYYDQWLLDSSLDEHRFCSARARVLRSAIKQHEVLDAVIAVLAVPSSPTARRTLSIGQKQTAIARHISHIRKLPTSRWHGCAPGEIFASALFYSKGRSHKQDVFFPVSREADLAGPVADWLTGHGFSPRSEIPMGTARADLVGYRAPAFLVSERVVSVELKNTLSSLKRALDQMATYADYSHRVYLGCTPTLVAQYLRAHCEAEGVLRWDPDVLNRRLKRLGSGLLLVEGSSVFEWQQPKGHEPRDQQLGEVRAYL